MFLNKKAFTLIELLVVMTIIGTLIAVATPRFTAYTERAKISQINHEVNLVQSLMIESVMGYKDEDKVPAETTYWEQITSSALSQGTIYGKEGEIERDLAPGIYLLIPKAYLDATVKPGLKGEFYSAADGTVYYKDGE